MPFDLQRLTKEQNAEKEAENKRHAALAKKNRRRFTPLYVAGVTAVALLVGLVIYDPFTQSVRWGVGANQVAAGGTSTTIHSTPDWSNEADNKFPLDLEAWQKTPYNEHDDSALASTILESPDSYNVTIPAQILPSTSTGYTDHAAWAFKTDGSKNMLYSLWTQENFSASAIIAVERLINPTFGGWAKDSRTNDLASIKNTLSDLFTGDYLASETSLPVLTDSTPVPGFTMGDGLPSDGIGWTGRISDQSIEFIYDETTQNYTATLHVIVTYAIWTADSKIVTTTGDLTLQLIPNQDAKAQTDRVLISNATFTVGVQP